MKLLKLYKYKEQARTLMDLLQEKGIKCEEHKLTPTEILVGEEHYEEAKKILIENEKYIIAASEKWFAVTTTPDEITAEIVKSALDTAGIPCLLKGLAIPYGEPIIMGQSGIVPMEILVPESFFDLAREIIQNRVSIDEYFDNSEEEQK